MTHYSSMKIAASAAALCLALVLGGCNDEKADLPSLLPQKLDTRVEMKLNETRTVHYRPGTNTKLTTEVEFTYGETGELDYYREGPAAGNIKEGKFYFAPKKDAPGEPRLKRAFQMDTDGRTYLWHRVYWESGLSKHVGERHGEKYETSDFQADGTTLVKHRIFAPQRIGWMLLNEQEYWPNSALKRTLAMNSDQSGIIEEFTDRSVLVSRSIIASYGFELVAELYAENGTLNSRITRDSDVKVERFESGRKVEELYFHFMFTAITRTFYDASEKPVLRQYWSLANRNDATHAGKVQMSDYELGYFQLFDSAGEPYKQVTFWAPPMTPVTIAERNEGAEPGKSAFYAPGTMRVFRQNGTLEKVIYLDQANSKYREQKFPAEALIFAEPLDERHMEPKPFDQPSPPLPGAPPKGE